MKEKVIFTNEMIHRLILLLHLEAVLKKPQNPKISS